ncbi:MAG: VWA domain-containing protein [archaeon]
MEIIIGKPIMLLFLLVLPPLIILHYYFFQHTKKRAMKFSNFSAMKRVTGTKLLTRNNGQLIIRIITLMILIIASSTPVLWHDAEVSITDYVIAIDASASMTSEDVLPNRLEVAKQAASAFLARQKAETKIGVLSFSGVSLIKTPLISDLSMANDAIDTIQVELAGGTDIGNALITSVNMLLPHDKTKSIILISDGSDTSGVLLDDSIDTALDYVEKNEVIVNTIFVGSGGANIGYVKELSLPAVYDTSTLKRIADRTSGKFYEVRSTAEIAAAFRDIENSSETGRTSKDLSSWLFGFAFMLLLFEWVLMNTRFRALP